MQGLPIRFVPVDDEQDARRGRRALADARRGVVDEFGEDAEVGKLEADGFEVVVAEAEVDAKGRISVAVARGLKKTFGAAGFEVALSGAIVPVGNEIDASEIGL